LGKRESLIKGGNEMYGKGVTVGFHFWWWLMRSADDFSGFISTCVSSCRGGGVKEVESKRLDPCQFLGLFVLFS
jgi:hypothetical protein